MAIHSLDEESRKYRKEFSDLHSHSEHYRRKCAEKAHSMSQKYKALDLVSTGFSLIIIGILGAALSGFIPARTAQVMSIILSSFIAGINAVIKRFYDQGEVTKLFYAAAQFLGIKEKAAKLKLQCGVISNRELITEYQKLNDEYTNLKKAFIEYMRTSSYRGDRRRRKIKILGKKFTELPPMKYKDS